MTKLEPGMSSFRDSTKRGMNRRWCFEGAHGIEQFVNIHIITGTLPLENWFNICSYSGALNNMQLGLLLLN